MFILEFLLSVGDHYRDDRRAKQFIFDLLSIQLSGLFNVDRASAGDHAVHSVPITFQTFLREYIQRNHLTSVIINHVTEIWVRKERGKEGGWVGRGGDGREGMWAT